MGEALGVEIKNIIYVGGHPVLDSFFNFGVYVKPGGNADLNDSIAKIDPNADTLVKKAINYNVVINTIDNSPPESHIEPLPSVYHAKNIELKLSGKDRESEIKYFYVYVPFVPARGHKKITFFGSKIPYYVIKIFDVSGELLNTIKE